MIALRAPSALSAVGVALGASWDERIFPPGSHLDFDPIAAAGPSALPALIERGRALFKAKFTATGARDDRGLAGDPRRGHRRGLRHGQRRARRPGDGDRSPSYRVFVNQFVVVDRKKPQAADWYPGR